MTRGVDQWDAPSQIAGNNAFITWARSQSEPRRKSGIDFGGYELHAHPDLEEVLEELVDQLPARFVNAFGVPAVANHLGLIFAFAYGDRLYIRAVPIPGAEYLDKLGGVWPGLAPWFPPSWATLTLEQRLAEKSSAQSTWLSQVRGYVNEAFRRAGETL
jgi:hypothetical protein